MMMPTTSGSVSGLIDASVCPPRITAVTENPSLWRRGVVSRHSWQSQGGKYSLCEDVEDGVDRAPDVARAEPRDNHRAQPRLRPEDANERRRDRAQCTEA